MKIILLGMTLLLLSNPLVADHQEGLTPESVILEVRASYFRPSSSLFRHLIHQGGVDYQLTGTVPLFADLQNPLARGVNLWAGIDYFSKMGHSSGFHEKTRFRIIPLTLGFKYFFPSFGKTIPLNLYTACGLKYYFLHNHNSSRYVKKKVNRNGASGVFEVGCLATFCDNFICDLFASYSYKSFKGPSSVDPAFEGSRLNVGGFNLGVGFGYAF